MEIELSPKIDSEKRIVNRLGFYSSLIAFVAVAGYCIAQLLQVAGTIKFPLDAILIYGFSLGIAAPYVIAVIALHHLLPMEKRIWSHLALVFAIMYAVYVNLNYVVQLATVIPASLRGSLSEISILDQTPHSLFWDIDALGYICMGIATFVALPALGRTGFERWVRLAFLAHALVTPLITIVYFYPAYSQQLLFLGFPWAITAPLFMLLLAIHLRQLRPMPA